MSVARVGYLMFGRQRGKGEKTAAGSDKRKKQPASGHGVLRRIGDNKPERYQGIKQKIEGNIEKSPRVAQPAATRQRAI